MPVLPQALQLPDIVCRLFLVVGCIFHTRDDFQYTHWWQYKSEVLVCYCAGGVIIVRVCLLCASYPVVVVIVIVGVNHALLSDPLTLAMLMASSKFGGFEAVTFPSILLEFYSRCFLLGLLALAIDATCAFRAEEIPSLISCWMAAKVMIGVSDVDVLLGGILSTQDST
ncbi:hypothetical protein Tco_0886110 [Tanacetum coccineum]